jgi:Kef-type K+ transport system membrane component KefB
MHCSFSPDGVVICAAELELCSPHLKSSACCILVFIGCLICELDTLEWQLLRPIYKRMADNQNAELFAANTLLVVLATSLLTARSGLSMALGAFLAGLLLAETEFALQVESDIAPYRGLLLGLFFMTVSALCT